MIKRKKWKKITAPEEKGDAEINEVRETKKLRSASEIRGKLYGSKKEKE